MADRNRKLREQSGPGSAGQTGDNQQVHLRPEADSESVEELLEEGNSFEAEAVLGVENAPDPDAGEVRVHQIPEDDVPDEYLGDSSRDVG